MLAAGDGKVLRIGANTPGDIVVRGTIEGARVFFAGKGEAAFPESHFSSYADFVGQAGQILKHEARTLITRVCPSPQGGCFAVKVYRYRGAAQLKSWYRQSTCHAEFAASCHLRQLGIPCVAPVACGLRRSWIGSVQSCFLITEFAEGFESLRDWLAAHPSPSEGESRALGALARALGEAVREMHVQRLFVSRLSAKNVLVRLDSGGDFQWQFIDHPFAGFHRRSTAARFMQLYDLGRFKNSLLRFRQESFFENFVAAYLPDPLGQTEDVLRRNIAYGVSIRHHRRPLARVLRGIQHIIRPGSTRAAHE